MWLNRVPTCSHCSSYRTYKSLAPQLKDREAFHSDAPRKYLCQTVWTETVPKKSIATSSILEEAPPDSPSPPPEKHRRKKIRLTVTPKRATSPVVLAEVITPSTTTPRQNRNMFMHEAYTTEIKSLKTTVLDLKTSNAELEKRGLKLHGMWTELTTKNGELKEKNSQLQENNSQLKLQLALCEVKIFDLRTQAVKTPNDFSFTLKGYIESVKNSHPKGTWRSTIYHSVVSEIWESLGADDNIRPFIADKCREYLMPINPFQSPEEVLRIMDLNGAVLNLGGIRLLREVEVKDVNGSVVESGTNWMTSSYQIRKAQTILETAAQLEIPFRMLDDPPFAEDLQDVFEIDDDSLEALDGIQFNFRKLLWYILKLYKLDEILDDPSEGPVLLAITLDGADLSRNYTHVTCGIKIVDPRAIDPLSGLPIGIQGSRAVQSRDLCHAFQIVLAKDSSDLYEKRFKTFFNFFKKVTGEGFHGYGADQFCISSPQDVSSFWKCLKRGGACKRDKAFCAWCACQSRDCYLPRVRKCQQCLTNDRPHCYHWEVGDASTLERLKDDFTVLARRFPFLQEEGGPSALLDKLSLHLRDSQADKAVDISNIDFEPPSNLEKKRFSSSLNIDLALLKLSTIGNLELRRARLRSAIEVLLQMKEVECQIGAAAYAGAWILIDQAIPCILHCENRCGEKILKMLLLEGWNYRDGDNQAREKLLRDVTSLVNTNILGTRNRPANWRIVTAETSDGKKTLGDQSMPNRHVRKFIDKIDLLADLIIVDEERLLLWKDAVSDWSKVMVKARQREDFSDEDIDEFSDLCDRFFEKWIGLNKRDGLTNYFHMVGAGHLTYYLRKYRNLYRYSQQGWESLNAMIKQMFFRRTQRGGNGGKKDEINSKTKPLGRWIQRRLVFMTGNYKKYFRK